MCRNKARAIKEPQKASECAGVPKRYQSARRSDFKIELPKLMAVDSGIFLTGSTGIGKTHAAAALFNSSLPYLATNLRIGSGYDCAWWTTTNLLQAIKSTFGKDGNESESEFVKRIVSYKLLVIDDLGAERHSDWSVSILYSIIANRVDNCVPTIITSNLGLKEINSWEPRIASRLAAFECPKLPKIDRRVNCV